MHTTIHIKMENFATSSWVSVLPQDLEESLVGKLVEDVFDLEKQKEDKKGQTQILTLQDVNSSSINCKLFLF